eukprot:760417_1
MKKFTFQKLFLLRCRGSHNTLYQCKTCNTHLPISSFWRKNSNKTGLDRNCKSCMGDVYYQWRSTPSGFFNKLIGQAKEHQMKKYHKKGQNVPLFILTREYMYTLYEKQNGLGFYSHIQLTLRPLSNWQASLERLDPEGDYVDGNVALE